MQYARGDRRSRAALADRDDRPLATQAVLRRLPRHAVGEMTAAGNRAAVPLVRFAHVEQLDLAAGETPLELVDRDGFDLLVAAALAPAGEIEDRNRRERSGS